MIKVILDLDTGVDDAMALAIALGSDEIELLGVVGTFGNVKTQQGVENVTNILELANRNDIPVVSGEEHAINATKFEVSEIVKKIHGENGFGQVDLPKSNRKALDNGVEFIVDMVNKYEKELTIVATGPLTNLAKAIKYDSTIAKKIGKVVIMGGALTVPGNVSKFAEANISKDPLAAKIVFDSEIPVTMVGLDVTTRSILTMNDTKKWRKSESKLGGFYADAVDHYIKVHEEIAPKANGCYLHDPSAIIAAIHPEWFTMLPMFINVEQEGVSAGRTIGCPERIREQGPNVNVCIGVQSKDIVKYLNESVLKLFNTIS